MALNILHTSDWHLGRLLYGRNRYNEFDAFLVWLADTIKTQQIDVLLVAGDIFHTTMPSNQIQKLYYQFLKKIVGSVCRHIVIIAGNHDSPAFLTAPQSLLHLLNIHIIGSAEQIEKEVIVLKNQHDQAECIVCAVPYLRDKTLRQSKMDESIEDKTQQLNQAITDHYRQIGELAEKTRQQFNLKIPIIGMGHLFTTGGKIIDGDGVRELYVGSLPRFNGTTFPACFDYIALGHLHVPQRVNQSETMRYSGSPIAMGFGEATQEKSVCLIAFEQQTPTVQLRPVPVFQALQQIKGDWSEIKTVLKTLITENTSIWVEIIYQSNEIKTDLQQQIELLVQNTTVEVLKVYNKRLIKQVLGQLEPQENLADLTPSLVFKRRLAVDDIAEDQQVELCAAFQEILQTLNTV